MSVVEGAKPAGLFPRVQNILMRPKAEWDVIAAEPATAQSLIFGYAGIIAAIPAIGRLIWGFTPHCLFGACISWNPVAVIVSAVISYVVALVGVFVVGLIIDALAPSFGGEKNQVQALKVAVYSSTAAWLSGIFIIVPGVGLLLSLLGLYSLYLLYVGLPKLMKSPEDKSVGYTVVVVILALVVFIVGGAVASGVAAMGALGGMASQTASVNGTVRFGGATVDVGKMQAAARQMEAAARQAQSGQAAGGKVVAVDPARLKVLLPDNIGGVPRTEISSASGGAAGMSGSNAEAIYQSGDRRITLTVTDLGAAGAFTAMAGAINVNSDKETATGYQKVSTAGGQLVTERYDNQVKSGQYTVVVANRFNISAEGSGVSMDDLKSAVSAVGPDRLAAMAHG